MNIQRTKGGNRIWRAIGSSANFSQIANWNRVLYHWLTFKGRHTSGVATSDDGRLDGCSSFAGGPDIGRLVGWFSSAGDIRRYSESCNATWFDGDSGRGTHHDGRGSFPSIFPHLRNILIIVVATVIFLFHLWVSLIQNLFMENSEGWVHMLVFLWAAPICMSELILLEKLYKFFCTTFLWNFFIWH